MVAVNAPGPVERVAVDDARLVVQGRLVLGRTDGLRFTSERAARFPRNFFLRTDADAGFFGNRSASGVLDTLLEPPHLYADDRRGHRGVAVRVTRCCLNAREVTLEEVSEAIAPLIEDGEGRALVSTGADVTAQRLTDLLLALRGIPGLSVQILVLS